jgi:hypothetical protein
MEVVYCTNCKTWVNDEDIELVTKTVRFGQIDPPDRYGDMPCCGIKVPWDDIDTLDEDGIIEALNKSDAVY